MVKHEESTNGDCFKELAEAPSILHPDCSIETFLNHPNVEIEYMDTVIYKFIIKFRITVLFLGTWHLYKHPILQQFHRHH